MNLIGPQRLAHKTRVSQAIYIAHGTAFEYGGAWKTDPGFAQKKAYLDRTKGLAEKEN